MILLKTKEISEFGFSVAVIRVKETKLLKKDFLINLCGLEKSEILKQFSGTIYEDFLKDIKTPEDLDKSLNDALKYFYSEVEEVDFANCINSILRIRYDFFNLKYLLKAQVVNKEPFYLFDFANIDTSFMKKAVIDKNYSVLPYPFSEIFREILEKIEILAPSEIEIFIDKKMLIYLFNKAVSFPFPILSEIIKMWIDYNNFMSFFRIKKLGLEFSDLEERLIKNGYIPISFYKSSFDLPLEESVTLLSKGFYYKIFRHLDFSKENFLEDFEIAFENFFFEYLDQAKYIIFGIEPLIYYILRREREIKILRWIILSKFFEVEKEIILKHVESRI